MERIQFYPEKELLKVLNKDAETYGVSISALVSDILKQYYGLISNNSMSETELTAKIFNEIKAYVDNLESGKEFDLSRASETFANIEMSYKGKPSIIRAKVGKNFARNIGANDFKEVYVQHRRDGKIKRNSNNAAIYVKK